MATDQDVRNFREFTGVDHDRLSQDDVAKLLRLNNNNLEQAVGKFFELEELGGSAVRKHLDESAGTWDDTMFGAGRYGQDETTASVPTFNIDFAPGINNYPYSMVNSAAPSRPSSRTSHRSAGSGAPMESIENTQQTGIVDLRPAFGPATRPHYDDNWSMVPTSMFIVPDPEPRQRQLPQGEPRILKPSARFNYLPAVIAILHSIPLFRNALLAPNTTQTDYWRGDDWWRGNAEAQARIVVTGPGQDVEDVHALDVIHEIQRLMAFLDRSDRAYATVSSLLELDAWKEEHPPMENAEDDLLKFLLLWSASYEGQMPNVQLSGELRSTVNISGSPLECFVLDCTVLRDSRPALDLYDVLDDGLFDSDKGKAHIVNISKVLILRLTSSGKDDKDLGCRIPATLYADRYLEANKPVIDGMYRDMKQYEDQLSEIDSTVQRLKYYTPKKPGAKRVETMKMLETSMKAFQPRESDEEQEPDVKDAATLSQLEILYQSIESKLAALDDQTKTAREILSKMSARFKPVIDDANQITDSEYPEGQSPNDAMQHPYHLRGVATHMGVVYLLHSTPGIDISQWWRVQYDTDSGPTTIRRDRISEDEVLERAATESASVLLIYAHDDALSVTPVPLSKPLVDFVQRDNLNFIEEIQKDMSSGWEDVAYDANSELPKGNWDDKPPGYGAGWVDQSVKEYHQHQRNESTMSSATLTPNTEHDDDGEGVREMVEINGGMDALAGLSNGASHLPTPSESSRTLAEEDLMDVDGGSQDQMLIDLSEADETTK